MPTPTPDAAAARAYRDQGFLVLRGVLPRERIEALRALADAGLPGIAEGGEQAAWGADGRKKLLKSSNVTFRHPEFDALASDPALVDAIEALVGPGARRFRDVLLRRPAGTEAAVSWHQDSAYWDIEPPELITAWIPLGDVSEADSCLWVKPGSHRQAIEHRLRFGSRYLPRLASRALRRATSLAGTGDAVGKAGGSPVAWKLKRAVLASSTRFVPQIYGLQDFHVPAEQVGEGMPVPVQAGDVILFHSLLLHASGPHEGTRDRVACIVTYMDAHARFVGRGSPSFRPARA